MKAKEPHRVPLSLTAHALIKRLKEQERHEKLVFPSVRRKVVGACLGAVTVRRTNEKPRTGRGFPNGLTANRAPNLYVAARSSGYQKYSTPSAAGSPGFLALFVIAGRSMFLTSIQPNPVKMPSANRTKPIIFDAIR